MTMSTSQLFRFLALLFLASVNADYVVYPRIRNNLRLNAGITDSLTFLLGAENVQTFSSRPRAVYEFWLIKATDSQLVVVRGMVGVIEVLENRIVAVTSGEVLGDATLSIQSGNQTLNDVMTVRQKDAPQDLDMVSWPPEKNWVKKMPGYDYEVTAGLDTYIYLIDNGVNMLNIDFAKMPFHPVEWHFAPSVSKLTSDQSDRGHGSCTASKALGWKSGVSKNSHLVVIKSSLNIADIHFSFSAALDDIIDKDRRRKSVILFPHVSADRYNRHTVLPKNWDAIKGLISEAFKKDIPVVVPAGNGPARIAPTEVDRVPALWGVGTSPGAAVAFPLIVAGSVDQKGLFADFSQGRMDRFYLVWAPGVGVRCASGAGEGNVAGSGTSFSAGMVAGLAAYKMTSIRAVPGTMAINVRTELFTSGRNIAPFTGPRVIWNGLNAKAGLHLTNVSVAVS